MKALLLVAHGSRREESNEDVRELAKVVAGFAGDRFQRVTCGFLEYATPGIAESIEECVSAGAREVVVLPYFLAAGSHVTEDVPQQVEAARRRHPGIALKLVPHAGSAAGLAQILVTLAE